MNEKPPRGTDKQNPGWTIHKGDSMNTVRLRSKIAWVLTIVKWHCESYSVTIRVHESPPEEHRTDADRYDQHPGDNPHEHKSRAGRARPGHCAEYAEILDKRQGARA